MSIYSGARGIFFREGKVTFPNFFYPLEISILVHPKQISAISKGDKKKKKKKVLCSFSYLSPFHLNFPPPLYNFPSFPLHFHFSLPLFSLSSFFSPFPFFSLFPSPFPFSSFFPLPSKISPKTFQRWATHPPLVTPLATSYPFSKWDW